MVIGSKETIPKTEAIKKKHLSTFQHKCLHSEDMLNLRIIWRWRELMRMPDATEQKYKFPR